MRLKWMSTGLISTCLCFGQSFSIGVKGGVRGTNDISGDATTESKRYIVGPMAELGLPLGLGVEFDALYRSEGYRTAFGNFAGSFVARERANSWEFPILLKYKFPFPVVKPYLAGGYAARVINGSIDWDGYTIDLSNGQKTFGHSHSGTNWDKSHGIVVGGGVRFTIGALQISPELRYTYWNNAAISSFGPQGYGFQSTQNQVDVLLGLGWKLR
jgi:hypothetical protein